MLPGGADGNGHLPRPRRPRRAGVSGLASGPPPGQAPSAAQPYPAAPPCTDYDVAYFKAYSHIGVHEEMLKDHVRTSTYRNAIMHHRDLISGKVVLDVGCGTGVLSIFCAFAGATRAMEIVRENKLSDKVVVLHGRIEDVNIEEKVDVIISEWMGYMLLYESMLGSVIFARDKWLKPGGLILPSHASLYMALSQILRDIMTVFTSGTMYMALKHNLLGFFEQVAQVDCYTIQAQELETISAAFKFSSMLHVRQKPKKQAAQSMDGSTQDATPSSKKKKQDVSIVLSTAPEDAPTHWQQTLLYLFEPIELNKDQTIEDVTKIFKWSGTIIVL
ncbi:hypothetical protein PR202_ga00585 [Eleusine coracana subsp. coracana]|uniref:Protein arginine N-methyltransferase domain-containing protein n=1 Tax=Eleusine coracana subsp. coracana TaxID=191504 RepID=A0AAV5BGS2_ELECO|nr:hypothetical protein PR202_ga00585 [Eleusine coracana subsp. coracana]